MDEFMIVRKTVNEKGEIVLKIKASWTSKPAVDEVAKMLSLLADEYGSQNVAFVKVIQLPDFI
jgi:hypothetical protein